MTKSRPTTTRRRLAWTVLVATLMTSSIFAPVLAQQAPQHEVAPLAPSDMTSAEYTTYLSLANDPQAQISFRDTRAFLRLCLQVEAGTLQPENLPLEPRDFSRHFVSPAEHNIIDKAVYKNVQAVMGGDVPTPSRSRQTSWVKIVPLAPSQMTPAELATYRSLGAAAQMSFRDTRAYLRLCQKVEVGRLHAKNLPTEPKDYDKNYLTASEQRTVDDAAFKQIMSWQ